MLISCPKCAADLRVNETAQGKMMHCPKCGAVIRVPRIHAIVSAPSAESPSLTVPGTESVSTTQSDTAELKKATKPKEKNSHTTVPVVVVLGLVFGLVAVSGGGFVVWYFYLRKTAAEQAYTELLDTIEIFVRACEKSTDPGKINAVITDLNRCNKRLERWIANYCDCEWPKEEIEQAAIKHKSRALPLLARVPGGHFALASNLELMLDPEFRSALERWNANFSHISVQKILSIHFPGAPFSNPRTDTSPTPVRGP